MKKRIYKKDFIIKGHKTGCRLQGMEEQVMYEVFTADGTKKIKSGFYKRKDADKWLGQTVKIANTLLNKTGI